MCLMAGAFETSVTTMGGLTLAPDQPAEALEYDHFGNYGILKVLGEGGMGTVYLAEQTHPFQRQVALKVIKPGMDTGQILSRFEYERQALALMDHPNIARVFDAGATQKGRPYFVMEYIEGVPITEYCDSHRLNTDQRLALFLPVCQAVQHAHQKGVIHRDLKPSNVLVTEQDGLPVPKVIDFGISKATDQRGAENAMLTQFGQFVGTPEYMSPEQADLVTNDVDTSSDVYSLGVVLYELLAGAVPIDASSLRKAGLSELLRVVREEEAPPMPARLSKMGKTATGVAERRSTDPTSLKRQLAGDLNWIVLKAVEKNRQRRYSSVSDLAADIRRHQEDQPVLASPPGRIYRAHKFAKRHRAGVLAAAGIAVALVVGFIATAWEYRVARRERADAIAQRSLADRRAGEATAQRALAQRNADNAMKQEQLAEAQRARAEGSLNDVRSLANSMMFELDDQVRDLPGGTKARETLTRLGLQYLTKVSEQAEGNLQLKRQLGEVYLKVGDLQGGPGRANTRNLEGARKSYERSVELLEEQLHNSPRDRELRHSLSTAYLRRGYFQDSEKAKKVDYAKAQKTAESLLAEDPSDLRAQSDLAQALIADNPEESRRALGILEHVATGSPHSASASWELARGQIAFGKALTANDEDGALNSFTKGLETLNGLIRDDPANVQYRRDRAEALSLSGQTLVNLGRFSEAVEREHQAVAIQEQLSAEDPRNAAYQRDLVLYRVQVAAALYLLTGNSAEVIESMDKTFKAFEEQAAEQPNNPDFRIGLASIHVDIGRWMDAFQTSAAALPHFRMAESVYRGLVREHPEEKKFMRLLANQLPSLASVVGKTGDKSGALALNRESLTLWESLCAVKEPADEDIAGLADAHAALAAAYDGLSRTSDAFGEDRAAIASYERTLDRTPGSILVRRRLAKTYSHLSRLYERQVEWKSALAPSLKAVAILETDYSTHPGEPAFTVPLFTSLSYLSNQYITLGQYDRGTEAARRVVEISEKSASLQPNDSSRAVNLAMAYLDLAVAYRQATRRSDSLSTVRELIALANRTPFEGEPARLQDQFAGIYGSASLELRFWEEQKEALPLSRRILPVLESLHRNDPKNSHYRTELIDAYRNTGNLIEDIGDDWRATVDNYENARKLALEVPESTAEFWLLQGKHTLDIASVRKIIGEPEREIEEWRVALGMFQRSRQFAAQARSASGLNFAAIRNMAAASQWIAFTREQLGDLVKAESDRAEALLYNQELSKADPSNPSNRDLVSDARASAVRLRWLTGGANADFSTIPGVDSGSPQRIQRELARGWRAHSIEFNATSDTVSEIYNSEKAIEIDRALAAQDPQLSSRLALAIDLQQIGKEYIVTAQRAKGRDRMNAFRNCLRYSAESRDVFVSIRDAKGLSPADNYYLVWAQNNVDTAEAKLAELQIGTAASPR